jgi:hypothetical protein
MPEQPQWPERTLDMPPQDPWAEPPTAQVPPAPAGPAGPATRPFGPAAPHAGPAAPGGPHGGPAAPVSGPGGGSAAPRSGPPAAGPADGQPFSRGRAQVNPHPRTQQFAAEHEPTGTGWPGAAPPAQRRPMSWHVRELRRGGEWSSAALLFAFVCWGIWAISSDGHLTTPIIVFILSLIVAAGLFALSRLVGRVVLEKHFHRVRRTARGSHIVAAVFLVGLGVAHLRQTEWVMDAYRWVVGIL